MKHQEQIARIELMQEETRKFAAETRELAAATRTGTLSAWQLIIVGAAASAALIGATAAAMKTFGT